MIGIALTQSDDGLGYDIDLSQGSMVLMEVTPQNQAMILKAHQGEYKEYPKLGVGIDDIINDHDFFTWKRTIREQIEEDGQRILELTLDSKGLTLEAEYK